MDDTLVQIKNDYELTDYQIKKFETFFEVIDVNKDGFIDFIDFILGAQYVKTVYNWKNDDYSYLELLSAKSNFWVMLQCIEKTILENKVNKAQIVHFFAEMANALLEGKVVNFGVREVQIEKDTPPGWITSIMITIFKNIDFDNTCDITKEEYKIYLESIHLNITNEKLDEIWKDMTADHEEDTIKIHLMEELVSQWLLNGDESNPLPGDYFPCGGYRTHWT